MEDEDAAARAARKEAKRLRKAAAAEAAEAAPTVEAPKRKRAVGGAFGKGGTPVQRGSKRPKPAAPKPAAPAAAADPGPAPAPPAASGAAGGGHEVFLKYLPKDVTEEELAQLFKGCGPLAKPPTLLRDFATKAPKGCGWVTFATAAGCAAALALNGLALRGRHLDISQAKGLRERPGLRASAQAPGTHTPALLAEVLEELVMPDPGGVYVDATFGRGGHTRGLLGRLSPAGSLHAFDMDPVAVEAGGALALADGRFTMHAGKFGTMGDTLAAAGLAGRVAGVLFDLGISSPQLDDPSRGFRPEMEGPLDLRFDIAEGVPAWQLLADCSREELCALLTAAGDGSQDAASAARVADAVALAALSPAGPPKTSGALAALVAAARCGGDYQPMHAAKLTFQALRQHVNDEFGQLRAGLEAAKSLLRPGGRICIITWKHSECGAVTDFLRAHELAPPDYPLRVFWEADATRPALPRTPGLRRGVARRPGEAELAGNARARSAVLHTLHCETGVRVADAETAAHAALGWAPLPTQAGGPAKKRKKVMA